MNIEGIINELTKGNPKLQETLLNEDMKKRMIEMGTKLRDVEGMRELMTDICDKIKQ